MNVKIPYRITNKQKAAIREEVAEEMRRQGEDSARRIYKLLCVALHEQYGFGRVRCMRLIERISKVAAEHDHDEVYWTHVDMVMDQLGIPFAKENYEEMERCK